MSWQNLMWPGEAGGGAGASRVAAGAAPAPWQCARACNEGSKVRFHNHREGTRAFSWLKAPTSVVIRDGQVG